ncbi:LysR substrate-binding domain-containing protein [Vreelandella zhanjiangensis]|uniref:LysR substrate-binding domain-containing protein n=1 Tax=Vreelandella zhanjiangensis TaxID=1121960 RepID=UPI00402AF9E4
MVETRLLKQFIAVAEELHFHRAAARLNMAQPPLSQAIARLEDRLGFQLFIRSKREVALTLAGSAFLETAYTTLNHLETGIQRARDVAGGVAGRLTVTTVSLAYYEPVLDALRQFRKSLPNVELVIQEMPSSHQVKALMTGNSDVAFMRHMPIPNSIRSRKVLEESILLALPIDHPSVNKGSLDLSDFAQEDFVFTPQALGPGYYHQLMALCETAGFYPRIKQEAAQLHTLVGLVASGFGIALLPECMANAVLNHKVAFCPLRPIGDDSNAVLGLYMNWHHDNASPLLTKFIGMIETHSERHSAQACQLDWTDST